MNLAKVPALCKQLDQKAMKGKEAWAVCPRVANNLYTLLVEFLAVTKHSPNLPIQIPLLKINTQGRILVEETRLCFFFKKNKNKKMKLVINCFL